MAMFLSAHAQCALNVAKMVQKVAKLAKIQVLYETAYGELNFGFGANI